MGPRVAFVVPVYNVQKYLDACLVSIRRQTVGDIEIICVDDVSTDDSRRILDTHAERDPRIKVVSHQANAGLAVARNTGLAHVKAPWVVFIDSDDLVADRLCECCLAAVDGKATDSVFFGYRAFVDGVEPSLETVCSPAAPANRHSLLLQQAFAWTKFMRVEFLRHAHISYPPGLLMQDVPVHWRLVLESRDPLLIAEPLVLYRQRQSSVSYRSDWSRADGLKVYDMVRDYLLENNLMEKWAQVFCAREMTYFYDFYITLRIGNPSLVGRALGEIVSRMTPTHWDVALQSRHISARCRDFILSCCRPPGCNLSARQLAPTIRHRLRNLIRPCARFIRSFVRRRQSR